MRWLPLAVSLLVTVAPSAQAQDDEEPVGPGRTIEIEAHGGFLRIDGEGWQPLTGGRVAIHLPSGLGFGASGSFAKRPTDFGGETEDANVLIATGEILYFLPSVTRANIYGVIGGGIARFDASSAEAEAGGADATELVIPVGLGILWYNHPGGNWWGIRSEIRDNIVFLNADPALGTDDAIANDWEITVGLALLFGAQ